MRCARRDVVGVAFFIAMSVAAWAEGLAITSFAGNGQLTFNALGTAETYRVEWASSPTGTWKNFTSAVATLNAIPEPGSGIVTCSVPMFYRVVATFTPEGMVRIPGGTNAGTDPDFGGYSLTVQPFYMDRCEVTKELWDEVKNWNEGNGYSYDNAGSGKAANHPVHSVNWYDCIKWCNARSQKEGRTPVYYLDAGFTQIYKGGQVSEPYVNASADGYRLPTDVQWEYAARAGLANHRFPWGDSDEIQHARANYNSDSSFYYDTSESWGFHPTYDDDPMPYTSPVGVFAANGYGLYDMSGNVAEWCQNWNPGGEGSSRAARGGGWNTFARSCRVADRGGGGPGDPYTYFGFRSILLSGQP